MLLVTLGFQGLSGVAGGLGLALDPSGSSLGLPAAWLEGSPFASYLVPGLVLLTVLGIGPLIVAYGVWRRRPWSRRGSLLVGLALFVWLGVEVAVIGYQPDPPLQLIYGVVGAIVVLIPLSPSVRSHLRLAEYLSEH